MLFTNKTSQKLEKYLYMAYVFSPAILHTFDHILLLMFAFKPYLLFFDEKILNQFGSGQFFFWKGLKTFTAYLWSFNSTPAKPLSGAQFQFNQANIGDICGTTFDAFGNIVVLHRGNHKWDQSTFGLMGDTYKKDKNSPITADTVVTVNATGHVVSSWGKDFFFLPHMITVCFIFCKAV